MVVLAIISNIKETKNARQGTRKTTFNQLFETIFSQKFKSLLKKLDLIVFAQQLEQLRALREISIRLNNKELSRALKLKSISYSQISRKLRSLCLKTVEALSQELVKKTATEMGFEPIRKNLGRLYLVDLSVISLCHYATLLIKYQ